MNRSKLTGDFVDNRHHTCLLYNMNVKNDLQYNYRLLQQLDGLKTAKGSVFSVANVPLCGFTGRSGHCSVRL